MAALSPPGVWVTVPKARLSIWIVPAHVLADVATVVAAAAGAATPAPAVMAMATVAVTTPRRNALSATNLDTPTRPFVQYGISTVHDGSGRTARARADPPRGTAACTGA